MKQISVKLLEDTDNDQFVVSAMENTIDVSVGQRIARDQVADWCKRPGVKVTVTGEYHNPEAQAEEKD